LPGFPNGAEFFAKAEGVNALPKRGAAAAEETLKKGFELEGTGDIALDFDELAGGKFFPTRADGSVTAEATEKEIDFREGKVHVACETDEEDAIESVGGIAALAANTLWRDEEATLFVVADGGGVEAGERCKLADFHGLLLFMEIGCLD
jgi:hypothetical protein